MWCGCALKFNCNDHKWSTSDLHYELLCLQMQSAGVRNSSDYGLTQSMDALAARVRVKFQIQYTCKFLIHTIVVHSKSMLIQLSVSSSYQFRSFLLLVLCIPLLSFVGKLFASVHRVACMVSIRTCLFSWEASAKSHNLMRYHRATSVSLTCTYNLHPSSFGSDWAYSVFILSPHYTLFN